MSTQKHSLVESMLKIKKTFCIHELITKNKILTDSAANPPPRTWYQDYA